MIVVFIPKLTTSQLSNILLKTQVICIYAPASDTGKQKTQIVCNTMQTEPISKQFEKPL